MIDKLENNQIHSLLDAKKEWHIDENALYIERVWEFENFQMAFSFMMRIAFIAESISHYPEWSNAYNRVFIRLSTPACMGVSLKDITFAQKIDEILGE